MLGAVGALRPARASGRVPALISCLTQRARFPQATSMFDINVAVTATVLVVAAVFAACAVGLSDLQRSRAAKIVD